MREGFKLAAPGWFLALNRSPLPPSGKPRPSSCRLPRYCWPSIGLGTWLPDVGRRPRGWSDELRRRVGPNNRRPRSNNVLPASSVVPTTRNPPARRLFQPQSALTTARIHRGGFGRDRIAIGPGSLVVFR